MAAHWMCERESTEQPKMEECIDLVEARVIDPAKVVREALQPTGSIAGLLITTEAAIVEAPKGGRWREADGLDF